jgi:hypothetical protein
MSRNPGGRGYLVARLGEQSFSRRRVVQILKVVFRQMGLALRRGEFVEFPFGYLKAEKRVEHYLSEEGERFLQGENLPSRHTARRRVWASRIFRSSSRLCW